MYGEKKHWQKCVVIHLFHLKCNIFQRSWYNCIHLFLNQKVLYTSVTSTCNNMRCFIVTHWCFLSVALCARETRFSLRQEHMYSINGSINLPGFEPTWLRPASYNIKNSLLNETTKSLQNINQISLSRVPLMTIQHWFRLWLCVKSSTTACPCT